MKRVVSILFVAMVACLGVNIHNLSAQVIFEDNFDSQADWQPRPGTNDTSPSGAWAGCDYGQNNSYCSSMPAGWTAFRTTGLWWGPTYQDTIRITNEAGRGGSGRAFIVYNESNNGASGDGWGADGQLTKLLSQDYQELYVRVWVRTQQDWQWPSVSDMMIKMLRVYHFDRAGSFYLYSDKGNSGPLFIWDFKHSNTWGTRYANAPRCDPQESEYYCSTSILGDSLFVSNNMSIKPTDTGMLADGNWHSLQIHLKMNTYNSATSSWNSDGIYEFWYDGKLMETHSDIQWKRSGSDPSIGWNTIGLGGNAYNLYADASSKGEQWYAMDDLVVSTTPIPSDYFTGSSDADTTSPTVVIGSPANNAVVSGAVSIAASASDDIGVTKVELYVDGSLKATDTASPYNFALDTTAYANGTHTIISKAYDAANNVGQSATVTVTVNNLDKTLPVISITSPSSNSTVSGNTQVVASASDNVGVNRVEFYEDGNMMAAVNTLPYSYTWNTTTSTNGTHNLLAKAYDMAGNVGQTSNLAVTVFNVSADSTSPQVSITSPAHQSTISGIVQVKSYAADNVGVTKVVYYLNDPSTSPLATTTVSPYIYNLDTTKVANGSYKLWAIAYDAAGNYARYYIIVTVNNTPKDTVAPTVAISSPSNGSKVSGAVNVTASATDNVGVSKVEFYVNAALQTSDTASPYSFSWNTASLANGSYTLSAKAYDAAGNVGASGSVTVTLSNDATPPTVSISAPGSGLRVSGAVSVTASATDNVGVSKVEFYVNGVLQTTDAASPYNFSWNTASLASGSYALSAKAYDAAGNVSTSASVTVTVSNDTTPPTVSISTPGNGSKVSGAVSVNASATDNVGVSKVEFYINGSLQATDTASPYSFSWNTVSLASGSYTLSAKAYDAAGNVGQSSSVTINVSNDSVAPAISITSPAHKSKISGTVQVKSYATDNIGVTRVEYYLNDPVSGLIATTTAAPYLYYWNTKTVANGTYKLWAIAYDATGNKGRYYIIVTVKN